MSSTKPDENTSQNQPKPATPQQTSDSTDRLLHSLSADEYFDYYGLGSYFKDCLSLAVELKPENPLNFFAGIFFSFYLCLISVISYRLFFTCTARSISTDSCITIHHNSTTNF